VNALVVVCVYVGVNGDSSLSSLATKPPTCVYICVCDRRVVRHVRQQPHPLTTKTINTHPKNTAAYSAT
jgi:hypothetical protein